MQWAIGGDGAEHRHNADAGAELRLAAEIVDAARAVITDLIAEAHAARLLAGGPDPGGWAGGAAG